MRRNTWHLERELELAPGMSNCYCELPIEGLPAEDQLLEVVSIRPITTEERERYDHLMK